MPDRTEITKCQTEQKLQNARQNRNYKMPDRTEITKCQTEQKLQNARQNRNYKMSDRTEIIKCQTITEFFFILIKFRLLRKTGKKLGRSL